MKKKFKDITVGEFYEHFTNHKYVDCYKCPLNSYEYFYGDSHGCDCDLIACNIIPELLDKEIELFGNSEQLEEEK